MVFLALQRCISSQIFSPLGHACLPQRSRKACKHQGERWRSQTLIWSFNTLNPSSKNFSILAFGQIVAIKTSSVLPHLILQCMALLPDMC